MLLNEAKILNPVEVYNLLPENFYCEVRNGDFWVSDTPLPNWMIYQLLPEGTSVQLINNQFVMSPSPSVKHQKLLLTIARKIQQWTDSKKLGDVMIAPLDVHFDEKEVYQPDILFISNEKAGIIFENAIYGAPDLVIELLSPSNANFDLHQKKDIYFKKKVREYWVIDSATKEVTGFELGTKGYKELPKVKGILSSKLLGKAFKF
jgi:Uma2 family endonuclease